MSGSTCVNCGASGVIIDHDGRCAGCPLPEVVVASLGTEGVEELDRLQRGEVDVEDAAAAVGFGLVPCLTRGEALDMIADANASDRPTEALRNLSTEWIGHANEEMTSEELVELLRDYIVESCLTDDVRSNGPRDDDTTGIIA